VSRALALAACTAALVGACVSTGAVPRVGDPDVARAQVRDAAVTKASLERGRSLYLARCTSCHQAFSPGSRSLAEWQHEVEDMSARSGLDPNEQQLILGYLATFSAGAPEAGESLDPAAR
jgi:mono/diheme cytochrome c family protein